MRTFLALLFACSCQAFVVNSPRVTNVRPARSPAVQYGSPRMVLSKPEIESARDVLSKFDEDDDGALNFKEFQALMAKVSEETGVEQTEKSLETMFAKADINDDGVVDFEELFIISSPVFASADLDASSVNVEEWQKLGAGLEKTLGGDTAAKARTYQLYMPIYTWMKEQKKKVSDRPLMVGMHCPQGGGKTTLTECVQELFNADGLKVASMSLDDFYLTHKEQLEVAAANEGNPLLQMRGNAGTQDIPLAVKTLEALRKGEPTAVPRYDKSAFEGKGDREPEDKWSKVDGEVDVVILEGWCLGFTPMDEDELYDPNLIPVNKNLEEHKQLLDKLDCMMVLQVADSSYVYKWREQAEAERRATGMGAMTKEQVVDFCDKFMPSYKQYLPKLYKDNGGMADENTLQFTVDANRIPLPKSSE